MRTEGDSGRHIQSFDGGKLSGKIRGKAHCVELHCNKSAH